MFDLFNIARRIFSRPETECALEDNKEAGSLVSDMIFLTMSETGRAQVANGKIFRVWKNGDGIVIKARKTWNKTGEQHIILTAIQNEDILSTAVITEVAGQSSRYKIRRREGDWIRIVHIEASRLRNRGNVYNAAHAPRCG